MHIKINGRRVKVKESTSVAAALINAGEGYCRVSVKGNKRAPFCGMGVCFECRARVNGIEHERTCMIACEEGMEVELP